MHHEDARTLPSAAQEEKRKQVVRLRLRGWTYDAIAEAVGLTRTGVFNIWQRYQTAGITGIRSAKRGRRAGEQRALTPRQEATIRRAICQKTPDQLTLPFALWTRAAVRDLIHQRTGMVLGIRTVGTYLHLWGMTPQKPLKKAYEQNPVEVQRWLTETYPTIATRAKREGTEIQWGDETGLRSDDVRGRGYAPPGQTPVVRVTTKRISLSLISTVTNQGKMRWMLLDGALRAPLLIKFLTRVIADADRKVFLILDNLRVHKAKIVQAWLAEHAAAIEVFYLPSYSPELNPDECLNADVKGVVRSTAPTRTKAELKGVTVRHMRKLQRSPSRIARYFEHHPVRYAA
jgi:transposase